MCPSRKTLLGKTLLSPLYHFTSVAVGAGGSGCKWLYEYLASPEWARINWLVGLERKRDATQGWAESRLFCMY